MKKFFSAVSEQNNRHPLWNASACRKSRIIHKNQHGRRNAAPTFCQNTVVSCRGDVPSPADNRIEMWFIGRLRHSLWNACASVYRFLWTYQTDISLRTVICSNLTDSILLAVTFIEAVDNDLDRAVHFDTAAPHISAQDVIRHTAHIFPF